MAGLNQKLAEFVGRTMQEQNLSTHDVARRSGNRISHATVWNVQNGRVKNIQHDTLVALAQGLGVPEDEVFAFMRKTGKRGTAAEKAANLVEALPRDRQEDAISILEALYKKHGKPLPRPPGEPELTRIPLVRFDDWASDELAEGQHGPESTPKVEEHKVQK